MKLGILSDTHNLLRPQVRTALQGVDAILHAGDVNKPDILRQLETIAPVHAVRGNNDRNWAEPLPMYRDFALGGVRIYMTHRRQDLPGELSHYDLVLTGHSHRWAEVRQGRTLFLNPGSCGPRRFHQPITLATAEVRDGSIRVTRIEIPHTAPNIPADDLRAQIELVLRESERGRTPLEIAQRFGLDAALTEQIVRLYVTHPGVSVDAIMTKMGL